ncbi:hypothetical protein CTI12_AA577660 [Artemisia annua]|uniref:Helitron helicase-like domain-containing protein n=1 Tax=Artemisia annua TaxID=35608 RepID=A0A2U1KQ09_ARTAN|nr:hypothetical protein CTI12_AA577660 [Artemisia annua]
MAQIPRNSYSSIGESTSQVEPMQHHHDMYACKNLEPYTPQNIQTNVNNLEGDQNLLQKQLVSSSFINGTKDDRKRKAVMHAPPAPQTRKKQKGTTYTYTHLTTENCNMEVTPQLFYSGSVPNVNTLEGDHNLLQKQLVSSSFINGTKDDRKRKAVMHAPPAPQTRKKQKGTEYTYTHLTTENCNMEVTPQLFYSGSVPNSGPNILESPDMRSQEFIDLAQAKTHAFGSIKTTRVCSSTDEGCSQLQQNPPSAATHLTSEFEKPHELHNMQNQRKVKNKRAGANYRNRKRQTTYDNQTSHTNMEQLNGDHVDGNSVIYSTETQNEALIHILDDNNELVQVFRTARDRVEEGNIPEFKIQLYNVKGAQEYQLPSSGTLGGIVFQPDANSQTDYDMIVEYRDRQPKRINKLHSSYMSLQFPLLFVYGQPGYNTEMTLKPTNGGKKRTKLTMNMFYKKKLSSVPKMKQLMR